MRWFLTFSLHCSCSSTSHLFFFRLHLGCWSTLKIVNDLQIFASYYPFVIVSLTWLVRLLFVTPDWLIIDSVTWLSLLEIFTRFFIYFLFLSDEGSMLETLDYTIRIASTPTILYFDFYLYSANAAHYVYVSQSLLWRVSQSIPWLILILQHALTSEWTG